MPYLIHLPWYEHPNMLDETYKLWCFQLCKFFQIPTTSSSLCNEVPLQKRKLNCLQKQLIWFNLTLHCYSVNYITIKCHFNEVSTPIVIICGTWWWCTGCFSVRWVVKWRTMPSCKCPSGKRLLSLLWSDIWCSIPWCIWGTSSRFETGPEHSVWWLPSAKTVIKETVIFTQQVNVEIMRKINPLNACYLVQQDKKCVCNITLRYTGPNY
jgi:hypothetical protein